MLTRRRVLRRLLTLLGLTTILWLMASLAAAYWLTRRPHRLFPEPPPTVAWGTFEPERLRTRDGQELGAWYRKGEAEGPSVLLLHGNRGCRWNCLDRAEIYAGRGCSVLLISFRAHGDSTGEFNDVGYGSREDVISAVEFLERRRPGRPILVHGVSMGAAVATFASRALAHRVQGYILESPYRDLKVAVRNRTRASLPPVLDWVAYRGLVTVSPVFLPELDHISPLAAIEGIPGDVPVLMLAGDAAHLARPAETRALFDRIRSHATLVTFENAGHHNLLATAPDPYKRAVLKFVDAVNSSRSPQPDSKTD
ncbi:MAG TPA: alpha/beta hydrolase [Isosphaeraceae bacterium]|nr:alpha/beta hydrolase [Isosphaeraceae bacterium]